MKLRTKHKLNTHFSTSSMTDVVFLLLIFFMLSAAAVTPQALTIDLPTSNHAEETQSQVNVTITAALDYYVDQQKTAREQLGAVLRGKLAPGQSNAVLLQIDQTVSVAHMVYVTDLATALQAKVAVATKSVP
ncbi:MAG: biopolymer transporter ExbD [Bacteroidota bacterium]